MLLVLLFYRSSCGWLRSRAPCGITACYILVGSWRSTAQGAEEAAFLAWLCCNYPSFGHPSVCFLFEQVTLTAAVLLRTRDNFDHLLYQYDCTYPYACILDNKTTLLAVPAMRKVSVVTGANFLLVLAYFVWLASVSH